MKKLSLMILIAIMLQGCFFNATLGVMFDQKDSEGKVHKVKIYTTVKSKSEVEVSVTVDEMEFSCGVHYGKENDLLNSTYVKNIDDFKVAGEIEAEINGVNIKCKAKT